MKPNLSIIIVYYNTPGELISLLESIKKQKISVSYEIIIVDNASARKVPQNIITQKNIKLILSDKNLGYSGGINKGVKHAKGKYLIISNCDVIFLEDSINSMLKRIKKENKLGVIGPQVLSSKKTILRTVSEIPFLPSTLIIFSPLAKIWPFNKVYKNYHMLDFDLYTEKNVSAVGGACMLIKREIFERVKGFDSRFFMYFEEADFCYRITQAGKEILYFPSAKIVHYQGRSNADRVMLKKIFEQSRFKFFRKYHGLVLALIGEVFLRISTINNIVVFAALSLSAFMNLYRINSLMMFIGDFGRDYLVARDMILSKNIPLIGIQSSVKWLHQGPISIYLIGLSFLIGRFSPVAPAISYGIIGVITTYLVYVLGRSFFNKYIGVLSAIFYATSPLIITNARMPYHTSLIPFFACIFFFSLYKTLKNKNKNLFFLFFSLGLLLQVELSNIVVVLIIFILWFIYNKTLNKKEIFSSLLGFLVGILPFVLYDISHNFVQTIGFPIWIINRIRLFFGLTISKSSTTAHFPSAAATVWQQIVGVIFPWSILLVLFLIVLALYVLYLELRKHKDFKNISLLILLNWIFIPIIGFTVHATPGIAYFPLIYPAIALVIGYTFYYLIRKYKYTVLIFVLIVLINGYFTIKNDYFLNSKNTKHVLPPYSYSFGYNLDVEKEVSRFIVLDSRNKSIQVIPGGSISIFKTSVDNFKYLAWWMGASFNIEPELTYIIYQDKKEIPANKKIVFSNSAYHLVKDEKN